ncbi:MAG: hypothetical protein U0L09_09135 [Christensenellales bacterium]|nr:hypothetical protein [Christensenellales bacterium]
MKRVTINKNDINWNFYGEIEETGEQRDVLEKICRSKGSGNGVAEVGS